MHAPNNAQSVSMLLSQRSAIAEKGELKYCQVTFLSNAIQHHKQPSFISGFLRLPARPTDNSCTEVKINIKQ
jgi:hypothetical protein